MSEKKTDGDLRQLDREIAELLGWREHPELYTVWEGEDVPVWLPPDADPPEFQVLMYPAYSSTWEGYGLLVEEWERQGWNYQVSLLGRHDEFGATPGAFICSAPGYRPFWHIERTGNDIRHAAARATRDALKAAKKE